jgi:uncharacterized protein (TIGR00251 family)
VSPTALSITTLATGVRFAVRARPRASRDDITGVLDGRLVVRVTAPPVDSAANDAIVRVIAAWLDVPRSRVTIARGGSGRNKVIEVQGATEATIRRAVAGIAAT